MVCSRRFPLTVSLLLLAAGVTPAHSKEAAFVVDAATSRVRLHLGRAGLMKFMGHEHHLEAPLAEGRVLVVEGDPARSSVRLRFEATKLAIVPGSEPAGDIPAVEQRMRGPEVLDVTRFPEIAFASTGVQQQPAGEPGLRLLVVGTLVLRGRAITVEVPLEVVQGAGTIEARGQLELKLRDLGIEPPSVAGVVKVANRCRLEFEIRAKAEVLR
jgi:polyisoprenoid-binding protein YceI